MSNAEPQPDAEETRLLLDELAAALHRAALPADLIEAHLQKIAGALGVPARALVLQSAVFIDAGPGSGRALALCRMDCQYHWNLQQTRALVRLARALAAGELGPGEGRARLARIQAEPGPYPKALVVAAYGVYGAVVAARVGGAGSEMLAAAVVGLIAGGIHLGALASRWVDLVKSFLAAFAGAACALALGAGFPQVDPVRALFGGVTLLVPAMVIVLATHELAHEAIEAGTFRLSYGLLRFLMLGAGIVAAVKLARVARVAPGWHEAVALPFPVVLLIVAVGGAALTVCLQGRPRDLGWITGGAVLAYVTQTATKLALGEQGSPFLSAFVVGAAGNLVGRLAGQVPATVIVPGLLQLAPGFLGTQAVVGLLQGGAPAGHHRGFFDVVLVALQLVTGLLAASLVVRPPGVTPASPRGT